MSDILPDLRFYGAKRKWPKGLHVMPYLLTTAADEITRLRTALSEAEQRVTDARRIATNAEHYGYMHGVQAAADIVAEVANVQKQAWDDHVASGVKTNATSFHIIFSELASRIRSLIPSEPHDAEGRAKEALQKLAAITEDRAQELLDRWSKDLGATPETKAAGVAAHIINDLHAEISVMLTRLDRAALERSEG